MFYKVKRKLIHYYFKHICKNRIRHARSLGVRIGERCQILDDPEFVFGSEPWLIKLGNHVDITNGVRFLTHEGGIWCARGIDKTYEDYDLFKPITIGDNVMIGSNSIIMPGVVIGSNVIIGGHSVVTKNIPDGVVVAGIPAKQISTVESFMAKLKECELFPTKRKTIVEKKEYIKKVHPEWFS